MKPVTIAATRSVIENSIPGSSGLYDKDLLRATLIEAISLHLDGKHNTKGHPLSELSARLSNPKWPSSATTKNRALTIVQQIQGLLDTIERV